MDKVLTFSKGRIPLLISMPHAGLKLTPAVEAGLVDEALSLPDTDWHLPRLYDFAEELGASTLAAEYSRFVIDLNRPSDDQPLYAGATTGLFPSILFDGVPLFKDGLAPDAAERARYLQQIWTPYHQALQFIVQRLVIRRPDLLQIWTPYHQTLHDELQRLRDEFGYALLFDAHSIRGHVPHLFDGQLPDFNLGTFNGASCDAQLAEQLKQVCAEAKDYSHVLNGRFKGGHITRHYGDPAHNIHAVQLELAQSNYMEEFAPFRYRPDLAAPTQEVIKRLLETFITWGQKQFGR